MQRLHPPKSVGKANKPRWRIYRPGWLRQMLWMLPLLVVFSPGHSGLTQPTSPQPAVPSTEKEGGAPPLPMETPRLPAQGAEGYRYDDQGRRDPLEPLVKEPRREELIPVGVTPGRPLGPLERFDASALKLIAIVWGDLGRRALVRTPDGKSHFVTRDTYMGKYGGKVVAIENDHVVIEELYKDLEDKTVSKTLTLPLRRKDEKEG